LGADRKVPVNRDLQSCEPVRGRIRLNYDDSETTSMQAGKTGGRGGRSQHSTRRQLRQTDVKWGEEERLRMQNVSSN